MKKTKTHVAIVGAGPAGLAVAVCLIQRGIPYTLLERGSRPLSGLQQIDPAMQLLSPKNFSRMPLLRMGKNVPFYIAFKQFIQLLEQYSEEHKLRVMLNASVSRIDKTEDGFAIGWHDGTAEHSLEASHVVNATGIISSPRLPDSFNPSRSEIHWMHSINVRVEHLKEVRNLLVVGGGASAAEVLDRWLEVRQENSRSWLSLQSKLRAFTNPIFGLDIHYWIWPFEHLPTRWLGKLAYRIPEAMNGTHVLPAIKKGLIVPCAEIVSLDRRSAHLATGETLRPDLMVFATGFRYDTSHLGELLDYNEAGRPVICCCESIKTPGLFLMGYKFGRTFASPYLRGIARDAKFIARKITRNTKG